MGLSNEWKVAIFSVIVPIVLSFIIFASKKIIRHIDTKPNNEKKYNILQKEKKKIEEKIHEMELEEHKIKKKKNEKLDELEKINTELNIKYEGKYHDIHEWLVSKKNIAEHIFNHEIINNFELSEEEKETLNLEIFQIIIRLEEALLGSSYYLLDNLYPCITLDNKNIYKFALEKLLDEIPSSISIESKTTFSEYINYTINFLQRKI